MVTRRLSGLGASFTLHLLTAAGILWLSSRPPVRPTPTAAAAAPTIVFVQPPAGATTLNPPQDALGIQLQDDGSALLIPGFTFDLAKIARRATSLFPFLTRPPSLERLIAKPVLSERSNTRVEGPRRAGGSGLTNPLARPRADSIRPPLVLRAAAAQSLVDKAWSRRHRWNGFQPIAALATAYSPDHGGLPTLLRAYLVQNGLQPYVDTSIRDPRLWTQLGLAADHTDFVDFISRYAIEHPSTKATTELMFLLDKLAEASLDALGTLLATDPAVELWWTRQASRDAFKAIGAIREYYHALLERRDLTSSEAIRRYYDEVRLSILTSILRTTPHGYRASDARFLIGAIYWKQGRAADALRAWTEMTIDPENAYVTACSAILTAIRAPADPNGQSSTVQQINRILNNERGRWISFSFDRLRQFGYSFDTF